MTEFFADIPTDLGFRAAIVPATSWLLQCDLWATGLA
jgi:hypothetical protein